jgi:sigma-B regulation protein RsbU (phosphoserine phosphatase)
MPQRILLIAKQHQPAATIAECLEAHGYPVQRRHDFDTSTPAGPPPALCLVDMAMFEDLPAETWQTWMQDCLSMQSACLGYHSHTPADRSHLAVLGHQADTLLQPTDPVELLTKVTSLLTIRKLARQLTETRQQMTACQQELQEALHSAAQIQRSLIPGQSPSYHNLHYAWRFMPSKKVGGDLFNVVQLDEETIMTYLVDVSGHGISSAMVTVSVHQSLSLHTGQLIKRPLGHHPYYEIVAPGEVMRELEDEYPIERFEEFFTISYLLLNPHTGEVRYSNAGHPPPILLRQDGTVERLAHGGTVIGLGQLIEFEEGQVQLQEGDRLFLYTDGITEYSGPASHDPYGVEPFVASLKQSADQNLDQACQTAIEKMRRFGGGWMPEDDVTLIGIEFSVNEPTGLAT